MLLKLKYYQHTAVVSSPTKELPNCGLRKRE